MSVPRLRDLQQKGGLSATTVAHVNLWELTWITRKTCNRVMRRATTRLKPVKDKFVPRERDVLPQASSCAECFMSRRVIRAEEHPPGTANYGTQPLQHPGRSRVASRRDHRGCAAPGGCPLLPRPGLFSTPPLLSVPLHPPLSPASVRPFLPSLWRSVSAFPILCGTPCWALDVLNILTSRTMFVAVYWLTLPWLTLFFNRSVISRNNQQRRGPCAHELIMNTPGLHIQYCAKVWGHH